MEFPIVARKRMIDPGFWEDEHLGECTRDARLLFVGLWCLADDTGRVNVNPTGLRRALFGFDRRLKDDTIQSWLRELEAINSIALYSDGKHDLAWIRNFQKYQYLKTPLTSKYPPHPDDNGEFQNNPENSGAIQNNPASRARTEVSSTCTEVSSTSTCTEHEEETSNFRPTDSTICVVKAFMERGVTLDPRLCQLKMEDFPWTATHNPILLRRMAHECAEHHVKQKYKDPARTWKNWLKTAEQIGEDKDDGRKASDGKAPGKAETDEDRKRHERWAERDADYIR
jgi:hypothetical protein